MNSKRKSRPACRDSSLSLPRLRNDKSSDIECSPSENAFKKSNMITLPNLFYNEIRSKSIEGRRNQQAKEKIKYTDEFSLPTQQSEEFPVFIKGLKKVEHLERSESDIKVINCKRKSRSPKFVESTGSVHFDRIKSYKKIENLERSESDIKISRAPKCVDSTDSVCFDRMAKKRKTKEFTARMLLPKAIESDYELENRKSRKPYREVTTRPRQRSGSGRDDYDDYNFRRGRACPCQNCDMFADNQNRKKKKKNFFFDRDQDCDQVKRSNRDPKSFLNFCGKQNCPANPSLFYDYDSHPNVCNKCEKKKKPKNNNRSPPANERCCQKVLSNKKFSNMPVFCNEYRQQGLSMPFEFDAIQRDYCPEEQPCPCEPPPCLPAPPCSDCHSPPPPPPRKRQQLPQYENAGSGSILNECECECECSEYDAETESEPINECVPKVYGRQPKKQPAKQNYNACCNSCLNKYCSFLVPNPLYDEKRKHNEEKKVAKKQKQLAATRYDYDGECEFEEPDYCQTEIFECECEIEEDADYRRETKIEKRTLFDNDSNCSISRQQQIQPNNLNKVKQRTESNKLPSCTCRCGDNLNHKTQNLFAEEPPQERSCQDGCCPKRQANIVEKKSCGCCPANQIGAINRKPSRVSINECVEEFDEGLSSVSGRKSKINIVEPNALCCYCNAGESPAPSHAASSSSRDYRNRDYGSPPRVATRSSETRRGAGTARFANPPHNTYAHESGGHRREGRESKDLTYERNKYPSAVHCSNFTEKAADLQRCPPKYSEYIDRSDDNTSYDSNLPRNLKKIHSITNTQSKTSFSNQPTARANSPSTSRANSSSASRANSPSTGRLCYCSPPTRSNQPISQCACTPTSGRSVANSYNQQPSPSQSRTYIDSNARGRSQPISQCACTPTSIQILGRSPANSPSPSHTASSQRYRDDRQLKKLGSESSVIRGLRKSASAIVAPNCVCKCPQCTNSNVEPHPMNLSQRSQRSQGSQDSGLDLSNKDRCSCSSQVMDLSSSQPSRTTVRSKNITETTRKSASSIVLRNSNFSQTPDSIYSSEMAQEPPVLTNGSKHNEINTDSRLPPLTPIHKPNFIENLKRELLKSLCQKQGCCCSPVCCEQMNCCCRSMCCSPPKLDKCICPPCANEKPSNHCVMNDILAVCDEDKSDKCNCNCNCMFASDNNNCTSCATMPIETDCCCEYKTADGINNGTYTLYHRSLTNVSSESLKVKCPMPCSCPCSCDNTPYYSNNSQPTGCFCLTYPSQYDACTGEMKDYCYTPTNQSNNNKSACCCCDMAKTVNFACDQPIVLNSCSSSQINWCYKPKRKTKNKHKKSGTQINRCTAGQRKRRKSKNTDCECCYCSIIMSDSENGGDKFCSVCVAVRIRPQSPREIIDMCRICTTVTPGEPQIQIGSDKAFTFDYVFGPSSTQNEIYTKCVKCLVEGALSGYNATVLAYGQTGSGKTYTMGTGFDFDIDKEDVGIIPRAIHFLFNGLDCLQNTEDYADQETFEYDIACQFMELYNEDIVDLLDPCSRDKCFKIHENTTGQINVSGLTIKTISNAQEALKCLQQGALARSTASTKMNDQSSRSHALFTILIRRRRNVSDFCIDDSDCDFVTTKFNFVDLAGSERLKRTGATGERAREGISINCGLLALGNVISALADKSKKCTHIPYRDSKLTRLLQDSLGGNSKTLMISCVSPCDRDFMETLNTLKYANRAKNIKNKVSLNENQSTRTICQLRREVQQLQMELCEYKQGKRQVDSDCLTDTCQENEMLLADNRRLHQRIKALQETVNCLVEKNSQLMFEKNSNGWSLSSDTESSVQNMIQGYLSEIETLQAKLIESEGLYHQVIKSPRQVTRRSSYRIAKDSCYDESEELINMARQEVERNREILMTRSLPCATEESLESCDTDDDSSGSSDEKHKKEQAELNDINDDIAIKSKLIEQLELSRKRMQVMRQQYEEKLDILNNRIANTRKERDEVLSQMGPNHCNEPKDKVKQVRNEYERKIKDLNGELKKLQNTEREHTRQQRELKIQETKLRNLKNELNELRCIKTRLLRKISENSSKFKKEESRKTREIALLRKQQRRQENTVKSLQVQMQAKDQILRRKNEEVSALRRNQNKALERTLSRNESADSVITNATIKKWDKLIRTITSAARNRQASMHLEKELERLMNERDHLCDALDKIKNGNKINPEDLASEEDNINSHIDYVQDNIQQIQQAIMEIEVGKNSHRNVDKALQSIMGEVTNISEAKYFLERLSQTTISYSCSSLLTENRLFENEVLLKEVQQENHIQQQMLQHCLANSNTLQISDLLETMNNTKLGQNYCDASEGSCHSFNSNETYDVIRDEASDIVLRNSIVNRLCRSPSPAPTIDIPPDEKTRKVRKHTIKPQELLFGDDSNVLQPNIMESDEKLPDKSVS